MSTKNSFPKCLVGDYFFIPKVEKFGELATWYAREKLNQYGIKRTPMFVDLLGPFVDLPDNCDPYLDEICLILEYLISEEKADLSSRFDAAIYQYGVASQLSYFGDDNTKDSNTVFFNDIYFQRLLSSALFFHSKHEVHVKHIDVFRMIKEVNTLCLEKLV